MTHGGTDKARWKGVGVVLPTLKWKRRARLAGTAGGRRVLVGRQMVRVGARGGATATSRARPARWRG